MKLLIDLAGIVIISFQLALLCFMVLMLIYMIRRTIRNPLELYSVLDLWKEFMIDWKRYWK